MKKQDIYYYYLFVWITVFKIDFFDIENVFFSDKFLTIFDLPNKGKICLKKIFVFFFVDTLQIRINIARHLELEKK